MKLPSRLNNGSFSFRSSKHSNGLARPPANLFHVICFLALLSLVAVAIFKVEDFAYQTKTVAGHNLDPTPWHIFQPKVFENEQTSYSRASKILQCNYFTCPLRNNQPKAALFDPSRTSTCPEFFRWIHKDLEPWSQSKISLSQVMEAKNYAAYRVIISGGALYVDVYYACVQNRMIITIWGLLQLLKRYPGIVPDVDMMFDCMDKPTISRTEHGARPLPLFRYCTTEEHFDIPFPDWSFWGWPETNVGPWDDEFKDVKKGSQSKKWIMRQPFAYWKGNPYVASPMRLELLKCNDTKQWRAQIFNQNWDEEARGGYMQSKLSNQCKHKYKIYAEGYAWSVSLKYIVSCGSLTLLITPQYEDFLTRGLIPKKHYWPVPPDDLCQSIKEAVDWGNTHPVEAEAMGKEGQHLMESLSMRQVYDYMFHLISEYSKLLDYKPVPPPTAREVCKESLLCFGDPKLRQFLEQSAATLSPAPPCSLQNHDGQILKRWLKLKDTALKGVVGLSIEDVEQKQLHAIMLDKYKGSSLRTFSPLEEQTFDTLTLYSFRKFQEEFGRATQYLVSKYDINEYIVQYFKEGDTQKHKVSWNGQEWKYACKHFEHRNVVPQEATSLPIHEDNDQVIVNDVIEAMKQISCPLMSKPKGRPREKRLKGGKELKHKQVRTCRLCKCAGHNYSTCPRKKFIDKASQLQRPQKRKKNVESVSFQGLMMTMCYL